MAKFKNGNLELGKGHKILIGNDEIISTDDDGGVDFTIKNKNGITGNIYGGNEVANLNDLVISSTNNIHLSGGNIISTPDLGGTIQFNVDGTTVGYFDKFNAVGVGDNSQVALRLRNRLGNTLDDAYIFVGGEKGISGHLILRPGFNVNTLDLSGGNVKFKQILYGGKADTTNASIYLYGGNTTNGGKIDLYNGANFTTPYNYFRFYSFNGNLTIGPSNDSDALQFTRLTEQWQFTKNKGITIGGTTSPLSQFFIGQEVANLNDLVISSTNDIHLSAGNKMTLSNATTTAAILSSNVQKLKHGGTQTLSTTAGGIVIGRGDAQGQIYHDGRDFHIRNEDITTNAGFYLRHGDDTKAFYGRKSSYTVLYFNDNDVFYTNANGMQLTSTGTTTFEQINSLQINNITHGYGYNFNAENSSGVPTDLMDLSPEWDEGFKLYHPKPATGVHSNPGDEVLILQSVSAGIQLQDESNSRLTLEGDHLQDIWKIDSHNSDLQIRSDNTISLSAGTTEIYGNNNIIAQFNDQAAPLPAYCLFYWDDYDVLQTAPNGIKIRSRSDIDATLFIGNDVANLGDLVLSSINDIWLSGGGTDAEILRSSAVSGAWVFHTDILPNTSGLDIGKNESANRWSNVWADLVNGADIALANDWRILESEKYENYPIGLAIGDGFTEGIITEKVEGKPIFAITKDFIEYDGERLTPNEFKKLIAFIKMYK